MGHIGGFITSYCRINVLEELFKIDHSKIYGFKLDGFVIDKIDNIKKFDSGKWKLKKPKISFRTNWYRLF